jgi:hypothetical protein
MFTSFNAAAQDQTFNLEVVSNTDLMTDETTYHYASSSDSWTVNFFCDQDGLNFAISYPYMIFERSTRVTYRIGTGEAQSTVAALVSSDGEHVWFYNNRNFLYQISNALISESGFLIQFNERVGGTHTFLIQGNSDINQLPCMEDYMDTEIHTDPLKIPAEKSIDYSKLQSDLHDISLRFVNVISSIFNPENY